MVQIKRQITKNGNRFNGKNPCRYITIHQTGNTSKGANAQMHANYIDNGSSATWHYTVDEKHAIQSFDDTRQCYHAGDGNGAGNTQSIGIELCINSDGDYNETLKNGAELVSHLMNKHNIPIDRVVQHNKWSGKDCPRQIRDNKNGISWNNFLVMCMKKEESNPIVKPVTNNLNDLVRRTLKGEFGNGEERKKNLGSNYQKVQDIINGKTVTKKVDIDDLVKRTIKGEFGNGEERKRKLGSNYNEVQKRINKMY